MPDGGVTTEFPGLTDIHAHPAMNAWLWHRDLRKHYWTGGNYDPLASLTDFKMLKQGGVKVLWSSLHVPEPNYMRVPPIRLLAHFLRSGRKLLKLSSWECLLLEMDEMERQVARSEDFELARSNLELDAVRESGRAAIVHTVEGGHHLDAGLAPDDVKGRIERLDLLAGRGVASLTIAHLYPNDLAGHALGIPEDELKVLFLWPLHPEVDDDRGLTPTGAAVIERMIELRMVPDVTHCTPNSRRDIYALVEDRIPVIASHIGVHSMNPVPYNLDRADVEAIAASGGVVGVIFMPYWLDKSHPGPGRDAIWRTMETLREWAGSWQHVALGTDFDGFTDPADDWDSEGKMGQVQEMLEEKGLLQAEQEAVLGANARRVLRQGWR
ncbi:MAG TPA: membrane dipeptidase [Solirubrobacterales bacterium]|nr:membrane dipeptidase [Solirubrobacterales bacterium]